jgi:hypothetical protein
MSEVVIFTTSTFAVGVETRALDELYAAAKAEGG